MGLIHPHKLFQDGELKALMRESPIYETVIQRGIQQTIEHKRILYLQIRS